MTNILPKTNGNPPKPTTSKVVARPSIIERLFADKVWAENYRITADERVALSNAAMMGEVASERDVLFILNQIRRARLRW
ncbi:MAG TPA: hypothetical protein VKV03_11505 [Candidatus Binataceae bacterium]|nr:hypothetical protein [Candidatus Binataceae bacterium]